jgi:hypothetical protein
MTDYAREVKRQLRDVYKFAPSRVAGGEPCFDDVPDGIYPMTVGGALHYPVVSGGKFHFFLPMREPPG